MGVQRSDQRLALIINGVASAGEEWRGGAGVVTLTGTPGSGGIAFQMSPDNGTTWVPVGSYGNDAQLVTWAAGATGGRTFNFKLPACRLRCSATAAAINVLAVSV